MRRLFAVAALLLILSNALCWPERHNISQISIPKAGTHLGARLIGLLTGKRFVFVSDQSDARPGILSRPPVQFVIKQLGLIKDRQFWTNHLCYSKEYADTFKKAECKTIFIYRDPRDLVISLAYYITPSEQAKIDRPEAQKLSFDDLILNIIVSGSVCKEGSPFIGGVAMLYNSYWPWLQEPDVLCVRFEDLVGSKGGGSDELQLQAIKQVSTHLEIQCNDRMLLGIAQNLFGPSNTFRAGQIGSWKKHFNKQHVDVFKAVAGDTLIQWGYEKDYNWGL